MGLAQKQRKIALSVGISLGIAIILAGVIVLLVIFLPKEKFCDKPASLPTYLYVYENDGNVTIQWSQTIFTCAGNYLLRYSINGEQQIQVSTTDLQHTVMNPPLCSDMLIQLQTVGESGEISEESVNRNYTVLPTTISVISLGVARTDAGVIASWQKPEELESCETSYLVLHITEFGDTFDQTDDEKIIVPEDTFCFKVITSVACVVGYSQSLYQYVGSWEALTTDLNVSISSEDRYKLIATWNHPNHDLCSMKYTVNLIGQGDQAAIVSEPSVALDIAYCLPTVITVTPSALDGTHIGSMVAKSATQDPDPEMIDAIEIDTITKNPGSVVISWLPISPITECIMYYQLEFVTDLINLTRFVSEPTFELFREFYCFTVEVEIRGVAEEILGEPTKAIIQYDVQPVQSLELNHSTTDNTLTALWTTNRWQEQCELEYLKIVKLF